MSTTFDKGSSSSSEDSIQELHRTIRFKFFGKDLLAWTNIRKTLISSPSKDRSELLQLWCNELDPPLIPVPRCEAAIGINNDGGKNLRLTESHDIEDANDIIITHINPSLIRKSILDEWTIEDLVHVINGFKRMINKKGLYGDIVSRIEIHVD